MELSGSLALVTGAARRLGKGIARALAESGCDVVVHYGRSGDAAAETVEELSALGVRALAVGADLERPEEIDRLFATVEERCGRLDLLVNSAAGFERRALEEIELADWERVMALNLRAPFLCLRRGAALMRRSRRPGGAPAAVVNVADLSGIFPWPGYAHHGVSKAGLLHLTRVAGRELAPGIRVNAVVPGPILPPPGMAPDDPAWRRIGERVPAGRSGSPADVGGAVVFLAASDFVYGEVLRVDGGEHLLGAGHRRESE